MTSELKQALEWIDEATLALDAAITIGQRSCNSGDHLHYANHERLIASKPVLKAAGLVVLLKETCRNCEGYGWTEEPSATGTGSFQQPCDDCGGRGWNPTEEAIYAAANVLAVNDMQKGPPDMLAEIGPDLAAPYLALAKDQLVAVLSMGDTK